MKQNLEAVHLLINYGAKVDQMYFKDKTILHAAVMQPSVHIVEILIQKGADVNAKDGKGETPIANALRTNPYPLYMVEYLARKGADINVCLNDGSNLLHLAAAHSEGDKELAHLLLYFGCHINNRNNRDEIPLLLALHEIPCKKHLAINFSKCLVKHGANVNDESIHNALHIKNPFGFVQDVHLEVFQLCIEAGLKVRHVHWINHYLSRNYLTSTSPVDLCSHISENMEIRFNTHRNLQQYLKYLLGNASSLKKICCICIREHLLTVSAGSSIYFNIAKLPLPDTLLKYLKLEHVKL